MATTGDSASTEAQGRQPTRRERAYLPAQLPDDFLCVEATRSTRHREPRQTIILDWHMCSIDNTLFIIHY